MPISRVRSVTDTSMMFMMPIPPTTSEIAAIPASSAVIVVPARCSVLVISCRFTSSSFGMFASTNAATEVYSPFVSASDACVLTVKSSAARCRRPRLRHLVADDAALPQRGTAASMCAAWRRRSSAVTSVGDVRRVACLRRLRP